MENGNARSEPQHANARRFALGPLYFLVVTVFAQCIGFAVGVLLFRTLIALDLAAPLRSFGPALVILLHASSALAVTRWLELPWPWQAMNFAVAPCAVASVSFGAPPEIAFVPLVLLLLVYLPTIWTRVPYYPTGSRTYAEVAKLLPQNQPFRFIDLGCGFGGLLAYLAVRFPQGSFHGVEISPLPLTVAKARALLHRNLRVELKNLWKLDFGEYEVVYAFLSPGVMADLWRKMEGEMRPESTIIINSFPCPAEPIREIPIEDGRHFKLLVYRGDRPPGAG